MVVLKRLTLSVAALLIVPMAFVPLSAEAAQGLTLLVFATPPGQDIGDTVDLHVEAYLWGELADVDVLELRAGSSTGLTIPHSNVSTGKYIAHFEVDAANASASGTVTFHYRAVLGSRASSYAESYRLGEPAPAGPSGWDVALRIANVGEVGMSPAPGDAVVLEARTYSDGALRDGGPVNATVYWYEGLNLKTDDLAGTQQAPGVYRFTFTVPAGGAVSTAYSVEASLGTGIFAPSDAVDIRVDPIPVVVWYSSAAAHSATVHVLAGGEQAAAGASVAVEGGGIDLATFDIVNFGPFNATAGAGGEATVPVTWTDASLITWSLKVEQGGNTTTLSLPSFQQGWRPAPNSPFGCDAQLQTDPATVRSGATASLKFRVTEDGIGQGPFTLARFVWLTAGSMSLLAGNATTDATGNMTFDVAVPSGFTEDDIVYFYVVCPKGGSDEVHLQFQNLDGSATGGSPRLTVESTTVAGSRDLEVTVTYTGTAALDNATAYVTLVPGGATEVPFASALPGTGLAASGSTFTGTLAVPAWYPAGSYTLFVQLSGRAGGAHSGSEVEEEDWQTVQVAAPAAGGSGDGAGGGGGGFLPGFEALGAAAAGAAVAAVLAPRRRRR